MWSSLRSPTILFISSQGEFSGEVHYEFVFMALLTIVKLRPRSGNRCAGNLFAEKSILIQISINWGDGHCTNPLQRWEMQWIYGNRVDAIKKEKSEGLEWVGLTWICKEVYHVKWWRESYRSALQGNFFFDISLSHFHWWITYLLINHTFTESTLCIEIQ